MTRDDTKEIGVVLCVSVCGAFYDVVCTCTNDPPPVFLNRFKLCCTNLGTKGWGDKEEEQEAEREEEREEEEEAEVEEGNLSKK